MEAHSHSPARQNTKEQLGRQETARSPEISLNSMSRLQNKTRSALLTKDCDTLRLISHMELLLCKTVQMYTYGRMILEMLVVLILQGFTVQWFIMLTG